MGKHQDCIYQRILALKLQSSINYFQFIIDMPKTKQRKNVDEVMIDIQQWFVIDI